MARAGGTPPASGNGAPPQVVQERKQDLEREGWRVDAMISDISMPRLNGLALVARVRARLPQLPIILMSGFEPVAVDADAVVPPDVVRLQKPFPLEVLLPLLHDLRGSAVT